MRVILLVQVPNLDGLRQQRATLEGLLRLPGVAGFSLRIPSRAANPIPGDWTPLTALAQEAGDIAVAVGNKEVQLRTMYGRWAPRHASPYWGRYPGGSLGGTDVNLKPFDYPLTFTPGGEINGDFYNWVLEAQDAMVNASLALRDRDLPMEVIHMSHPAGTWAEVFVIEQMADYPGFDVETVIRFHELVMQNSVSVCEPHALRPEFALSGHVTPLTIRGAVYGRLAAIARNSNPNLIINRNDIRNETNFGNMPIDYPLGWQSYASGNTYQNAQGVTVTYDWSYIFDQADAHDVVYYEAYPGNFSPEFRAEILRYEAEPDPCVELRAENAILRENLEAVEDLYQQALTRIEAAKAALG